MSRLSLASRVPRNLAGLFIGTLLSLTAAAQSLPLPTRPSHALSGTEFANSVTQLTTQQRENEAVAQILSGNVPAFLRKLCPVSVTNIVNGATNFATFYVTPDYLAIGSDADYLLMPLSPGAAQTVADALHCSLPTRKMVDAIYAAAQVRLEPAPIPPSPAMTSVPAFTNHNALVRAQRQAQLADHPLGALVAGHKKDVVISAQLATTPGKVAIYGWHRTNGTPIQPLYLGHTATWIDYSQCTRLVQQALSVNGASNTVAGVLSDPALAGLLSDEGPIATPRYDTAGTNKTTGLNRESGTNSQARSSLEFIPTGHFNEQIASLVIPPEVRVQITAPIASSNSSPAKVLLVFYALPNGNTIDQTVGKAVQPGDDWHFGIQHIGAQTRFLRQVLTNQTIVVAYLENNLKSWPAWRKKYGDKLIPDILNEVEQRLGFPEVEVVLAGHSGGGSLIFGYLNALEQIPDEVVRVAFLDSNYAYDRALGHRDKLAAWLNSSKRHALCVLAYNDAIALLNGKSFVSATGGTWGKSHEMQRDLTDALTFSSQTNSDFQKFSALDGRVQFILKENPERKILHTVQVERNGFIHVLLTGTALENQGYEYFGPAAYTKWISD